MTDSLQIGKTSSLMLTLSGVLKDILLVMASMVLFRDPVSLLQAFGYSIALGGLIYYKLGSDKLREYASGAQRSWGEFGANRPACQTPWDGANTMATLRGHAPVVISSPAR